MLMEEKKMTLVCFHKYLGYTTELFLVKGVLLFLLQIYLVSNNGKKVEILLDKERAIQKPTNFGARKRRGKAVGRNQQERKSDQKLLHKLRMSRCWYILYYNRI